MDAPFVVFVVFAGAALAATVALFAGQALLLAYIALGALAGPYVFGLIEHPEEIEHLSHIGIMFLLYLLGLNLVPGKLLKIFREAVTVTVVSSLIFASVGFGLALAMGFSLMTSLVFAVAATFSSTILGLKLLPTTTLHHRHMGEIIISVLLIQDMVAIMALLVVGSVADDSNPVFRSLVVLVSLPLVGLAAYLGERFVLAPLINRFDRIPEYLFLLAVGWCMAIAQLGAMAGLGYEIGAFIAGVMLADSPVARFIAESLRPLRDFFLVMFFFALGASLVWPVVAEVWPEALLFALVFSLIKPRVFTPLLIRQGEDPKQSREIGVRLGQLSEFSLLLALLAGTAGVIEEHAQTTLEVATIAAIALSSSRIVRRYPTPIATSEELRRD